MHDDIRLLAAAALFGGWLALFFLGHNLHGLVHLLPAAALFLVPWRSPSRRADSPHDDSHSSKENR